MKNRTLYSLLEIYHVWCKGRVEPGYSPDEWRRDVYGNPIKYSDYGKTESRYGWEIDHIIPQAKGGTNAIHNLQPLQWEINRRKSDNLT